MRDRDSFFLFKALFTLAAVLLLAGTAQAYTVPGPEFFTQFMSLVLWLGVAFSSVMLYPLYAFCRRLRGMMSSAGTASRAESLAAPTPPRSRAEA